MSDEYGNDDSNDAYDSSTSYLAQWGRDPNVDYRYSTDPFADISGYNVDAFGGTPKPRIGSETPDSYSYIPGINTDAFSPQYGTSQGADYTYDNTGVVSGVGGGGSGPLSQIAKMLGLTPDQLARLLMSGITLADLMKSRKDRKAAQVPTYKWNTPMLKANRTQIAQAPRAPGQGAVGQSHFTAPTYTARAAQGGIMALAKGGLRHGSFIIPADVVSHFGNGSSEAGLEVLSKRLGAVPIKGKGDGMSDSIDTTIEGQRPAKVAHEEAIVSPEKVAALGGGDPKKGANVLYSMMDRVRKARTGTTKQGKQINPAKFVPGGAVGYAGGGIASFIAGGNVSTDRMPAGGGSLGTTYTSGDRSAIGTDPTTQQRAAQNAATNIAGQGAVTSNAAVNTNIAAWAGPYVADYLSKGFALADAPYEAYTGALSAGASELQEDAFKKFLDLDPYTSTTFTNQYTAPDKYTGTTFDSGYNNTAAQFDTNYYTAPDKYVGTTFNAGYAADPTRYKDDYFKAPDKYEATTFSSGFEYTPEGFNKAYFSSPTDYVTGAFDAGFKYTPTNFDKVFYTSPDAYKSADFNTGLGPVGSVQSYMNPYMQGVVDVQAREARRQADIDRLGIASRLTAAGAYGGSRQAIMEAEQRRNLQQQIGDIQAKGSQAAYESAVARQFEASKRSMEEQAAEEASRQYAYGQRMTAAEIQAKYGLDATKAKALENQFASKTAADFALEQQKAKEASRQFGYTSKMTAADLMAKYGLAADQARALEKQFAAKTKAELSLEAQKLSEGSKQFGYGQQMDIAKEIAKYGFDVDKARAGEVKTAADYALEQQQLAEASKQFGYGKEMTAADTAAKMKFDIAKAQADENQRIAKTAADYQLEQQKEAEAAKQFGYGQEMTAADRAARYGLDALNATEESKQFGANYGLNALAAQMGAGSIQRGIEADAIAAAKAQFDEERKYPLEMQKYKQSLLGGLPIGATPAQPLPTFGTEATQALVAAGKQYPQLKQWLQSMGITIPD